MDTVHYGIQVFKCSGASNALKIIITSVNKFILIANLYRVCFIFALPACQSEVGHGEIWDNWDICLRWDICPRWDNDDSSFQVNSD